MIEIRAAREDELPATLSVHERAFGQASEARLVKLLHQSGKAAVSLVAVLEGKIAGSVVFSPVTIRDCKKDAQALGLAPVSVIPELQRKGIGSWLIRAGLERCREAGYDAVVVLGDPAYYSRFGFRRAADYGLGNEYGVHDEFMVMELREGALRGAAGVVQYAPEFREVES